MAKKLEKLREFIKVHVDRLLELEFIDEEDYNDVCSACHDNGS